MPVPVRRKHPKGVMKSRNLVTGGPPFPEPAWEGGGPRGPFRVAYASRRGAARVERCAAAKPCSISFPATTGGSPIPARSARGHQNPTPTHKAGRSLQRAWAVRWGRRRGTTKPGPSKGAQGDAEPGEEPSGEPAAGGGRAAMAPPPPVSSGTRAGPGKPVGAPARPWCGPKPAARRTRNEIERGFARLSPPQLCTPRGPSACPSRG